MRFSFILFHAFKVTVTLSHFSKILSFILSDFKGEGDETRLKKRRNSDSVLYCQREVEDTRLSEGKVERVEQWERSAFIWRYLENLPETFSEPSEIADSGVSTQSSFSELDTKEGRDINYLSSVSLSTYPFDGL